MYKRRVHLLASMEQADWSECKFFDVCMRSMDTSRTGLHENCKYIHVARGHQLGWADVFVLGWLINSGVAKRLERASGSLNCTAAQPSWRHRFAILILQFLSKLCAWVSSRYPSSTSYMYIVHVHQRRIVSWCWIATNYDNIMITIVWAAHCSAISSLTSALVQG